MNQTAFSTLPLQADLLQNLSSLGYQSMTPIQEQSLPPMLAGKDVIAQGKTGSGKTAAFGLGLLAKLAVKRFRIQSIVLCPTRELADQVAKEIRTLARTIHNIKVLTLCGGMPLGPQIGSLEHGAHIIVGTPGRIEEHLRKGTLRLEHVNTLVLDEADRMLDMGFQSTLDEIIAQIPPQRQTWLFSATYPEKIQAISRRIMRQPVMVQVSASHDSSSIEQHFYPVDDHQQRQDALQLLLLHHAPTACVVFFNTRNETRQLADILQAQNFSVLALHGELEQKERDLTLVRFANNSVQILLATDVAARGLDISELDMVVNYDMAHDPQTHTHRIGRTGRAGNKGLACTLYNKNSDKDNYKLALLEDQLDRVIAPQALPPANLLHTPPATAKMLTLQIGGGKKQKLRPGDILGALTGDNGIAANEIGKINVFANWASVAVSRKAAKSAFNKLVNGKMKGRSFRVRLITGA